MKGFTLLLVAAIVGFISANQPPLLDIDTACETSRDPFNDFFACMDKELPESVKNLASEFLECLGKDSFLDLLNYVCQQHAAGATDREIFVGLELCAPSPDRERITQEDDEETSAAVDKCFEKLFPYFEAAILKAAGENNVRR